jgi:hypothetical protein
MSLELTGKILTLLPPQSGNSQRGSWQKQDFIIETEDQYPKKICISVWGDKVNELQKFKQGENIKASINIESREFNGKWYTDVKAWRLEGQQSQDNNSMPSGVPLPGENDMPDFSEDPGDNLPF